LADQRNRNKSLNKVEFNMSFPEGFQWGAATAAYQIEGGHDADGKGLSIWDIHCSEPGKIISGDNGNTACDHYHRFAGDVDIMKSIGLQAYRFSLSWSRILPAGTGIVNAKGLDFYDRLIDALCEAGIDPWVTLFHWDLPYVLHCRGGWLNRDSADWFSDYAELCVKRFGDRVKNWITLNEPQCIALGYMADQFAPAGRCGQKDILGLIHNLLRAHGRAVAVMRASAPQAIRIGWAPVGIVAVPESDLREDVEAARQGMFSLDEASWNRWWNNSWYGDPVVWGEYPADGLALWAPWMPDGWEKDLPEICQPIDFFGSNVYNGRPYRAGQQGMPQAAARPAGYPRTLYNWPVEPRSLYWGPRFLHERYQLPIVVTENGMSCHDWVDLDGEVQDPQRIDFLRRYLRELCKAVSDGIPVQGYFHWSLMDNFEWSKGYSERFGLVHVDFQTQKRTLKQSAYWYRKLIAKNGENL
jgi:beta-glucosidase